MHSRPKNVAGNRIDVLRFGQRGSSNNQHKKRRDKKLEHNRSPDRDAAPESLLGSRVSFNSEELYPHIRPKLCDVQHLKAQRVQPWRMGLIPMKY
jgi:hypothetical protein